MHKSFKITIFALDSSIYIAQAQLCRMEIPYFGEETPHPQYSVDRKINIVIAALLGMSLKINKFCKSHVLVRKRCGK